MDIESNKQLVKDFYTTVVVKGDFSRVHEYLGEEYIQHSPQVENGVEGLRAFVTGIRSEFPSVQHEFKRVIAEGDLVATHSHVVRFTGDLGRSVMDWFRIENDRIVEHWECVVQIPPVTKSGLPLV